jgi:hypothetical protein
MPSTISSAPQASSDQSGRRLSRDEYATEVMRRYQEFRLWAMQNWPVATQPLDDAAFYATERELKLLLGARLHPQDGAESKRPGPPPDQAGSGDGDGEFRDVTPMPWP